MHSLETVSPKDSFPSLRSVFQDLAGLHSPIVPENGTQCLFEMHKLSAEFLKENYT